MSLSQAHYSLVHDHFHIFHPFSLSIYICVHIILRSEIDMFEGSTSHNPPESTERVAF